MQSRNSDTVTWLTKMTCFKSFDIVVFLIPFLKFLLLDLDAESAAMWTAKSLRRRESFWGDFQQLLFQFFRHQAVVNWKNLLANLRRPRPSIFATWWHGDIRFALTFGRFGSIWWCETLRRHADSVMEWRLFRPSREWGSADFPWFFPVFFFTAFENTQLCRDSINLTRILTSWFSNARKVSNTVQVGFPDFVALHPHWWKPCTLLDWNGTVKWNPWMWSCIRQEVSRKQQQTYNEQKSWEHF